MQPDARSKTKVFVQAASPALRPFVKRFLVVEFPSSHDDVHLPDTSPVAAFSFRGACRIDGDQWAPQAAFSGLREVLRVHQHRHNHAVLLATFTPVGANSFLRRSLEEFAGVTTDLTGILDRSREFGRLHEQLAEAQNHRQR